MMMMVLACFTMFYFQYLVRAPFSDAPNLNFLEANSPPLCILPWKKDEKKDGTKMRTDETSNLLLEIFGLYLY